MQKTKARAAGVKPFGASVSPWLVIGASVILAAVVLVLAVVNVGRGKEHMSQLLSEKGASLIRAIEAGARTGMMGAFGSLKLQTLLEETARQPDIQFLAVTDASGRILAHSDRELVGERFLEPEEMFDLNVGETAKFRTVRDDDGSRAFMVYREFLPGKREIPGPPAAGAELAPTPEAPGRGHGPGGPSGPRGRGRQANPFLCSEFCDAEGQPLDMTTIRLVIFLGMDIAPFEEARQADLRATVLTSAIIAVLGLASVVSLFWASSYRASRRQLSDARAVSAEVVAALPVGLVVTDRENRIAYVNRAAGRFTGREQAGLAGLSPEDILPAELSARLAAVKPGDPLAEREMEVDFGQGRTVPLAVTAAVIRGEDGDGKEEPVGRLLVLRDLTEVRRLEAEVRRREKLAAIGNLAAGVAHEIRNPLSSIKGYAAYFGSKFPPGSEDRKSAEVMVSETDRLNRVISDLLELSRPSEVSLEPQELLPVVDHSLRLVARDAAYKRLRIVTEGLDELPPVAIDPDRLAQALLNIYLNAIQAMQPGGRLTIRAGLEDSTHIFLEVEDTGAGIPAEDLSKVFDPYYTTKAKGTGLGLAIVHRIVEAHGGRVTVSSRQGQGTTVRLVLPLEPGGQTPEKA